MVRFAHQANAIPSAHFDVEKRNEENGEVKVVKGVENLAGECNNKGKPKSRWRIDRRHMMIETVFKHAKILRAI